MTFKRVFSQLAAATFLSSALANNTNAAPSSKPGCDPLARVYSGNAQISAGEVICKKGSQNKISGPLRLLCFLNHQWVEVTKISLVGKICEYPEGNKKEQHYRCTQYSQDDCGGMSKGGNSSNTPEVLVPYSSSLINDRPYFAWAKVVKATEYQVQLNGKGVSWTKIINSTALAYPSEQPSMKSGEVYQLIVTALSGSMPIASESSAFNLLSESEIKQIQGEIQTVKAFHLPADQAASLDLDSIYMARGLLTETINSLNSRVQAGSQDPYLYAVLADRYRQVGLPQLAQSNYDTAIAYARKQGNSFAMSRAIEGIDKLTSSSQAK